MKNKKAKSINIFTPTFLFGIIVVVIFIIFLGSGGSSIITKVTDFLKTIPAWAYVGFAVLLIFMSFNKGGRRRR